jgi:hypothetical protein
MPSIPVDQQGEIQSAGTIEPASASCMVVEARHLAEGRAG